jgi:arginine exporter protein ArgO
VITAFLAGAAAGYGIAIPVGAIAILIIETGLRRGFRLAVAAGAGAAAADGTYAAVAAAFGTALAALIAPLATPLRVVAVGILVAIGIRGLWRLRVAEMPPSPEGTGLPAEVEEAERAGSAGRTFAVFLGLTLLNPITVIYFAALILGLAGTGVGIGEKAAFVAGAFLASLSWQVVLAAVGAVLHRHLPPTARAAVVVLGNVIILAFAAVIAGSIVG